MRIMWDEKEAAHLSKMGIPFDYHANMSNAQLAELYDIAPDYMCANTDMTDTKPGSDFMVCEGIIDKLIDVMRPLGFFG